MAIRRPSGSCVWMAGRITFEYNIIELFVWRQGVAKKCIAQIQEETYNDDVNISVNIRQRTGTISRKDCWDIFSERK